MYFDQRDDLQKAVDGMRKLRPLIDRLRPLMTAEDYKEISDLVNKIAACVEEHSSCILRS